MTTLITHTFTSCKSHLPHCADGPILMSKAVVSLWMQGRGWQWGFQNFLALPSLSWLYHQNCGSILKVPIARHHKSETAPRAGITSTAQHPGAEQPFTSQGLENQPKWLGSDSALSSVSQGTLEYTKYFKWEDSSCSQCQTQNQCMAGSSQVLTLRLHLTWLNTKALCWQRNKSLPKTYSNYGCSQGPYKHQVPLPSSCVSFFFTNRIFKRKAVFWVRRL